MCSFDGAKTADGGIYTNNYYTCARNAALFLLYVKINRYFCFVKARLSVHGFQPAWQREGEAFV